jgi:SAM-dependent methyltransferase
MIELDSLLTLLQCPFCKKGRLNISKELYSLDCVCCAKNFPVIHGRPVLLSPNNKIFCVEDYQKAALLSLEIKARGIERFIPSPSINLARDRVLNRVKKLLAKYKTAMVLVVGSGCQREWLDTKLGTGDKVRVVYTDIDIDADVDLFCDGHDLPFADGVFDAVVTTAVLEHVLYPERVAQEIGRVLKVGGLLYSELPFMQQVHEGAYDFTRYTLSGHRRLFNSFAEIESGMVAGPATALVWAIENFVLAFISKLVLRKLAKASVRLAFFWLKYLDVILVRRPEAMDGVSCTFLFGRKVEGCTSDSEIIENYIGAKPLRHI